MVVAVKRDGVRRFGKHDQDANHHRRVIRDIAFYGKHTFREFPASEEQITTGVLSDRLATLVRDGILTKTRSEDDRRREHSGLQKKGLALIPILVELANWGVDHGAEVTANPLWMQATREDPAGFNALIRTTVETGGAVREPALRTILTDRDHVIRWAWRTHHERAEQVNACVAGRPHLEAIALHRRSDASAWLAGPLARAAPPPCTGTKSPARGHTV